MWPNGTAAIGWNPPPWNEDGALTQYWGVPRGPMRIRAALSLQWMFRSCHLRDFLIKMGAGEIGPVANVSGH
jgi:hypothetical protein